MRSAREASVTPRSLAVGLWAALALSGMGIASLLFLGSSENVPSIAVTACLVTGLYGIVSQFGRVKLLGVRFFGAVNLFHLMVWCFHCGLTFPMALGLSEASSSSITSTQAAAAWVTLVAFLAFDLGVIWTWMRRGRVSGLTPDERRWAESSHSTAGSLFVGGIGFGVLLAVAAALNVMAVGIDAVLREGYNSITYQEADLRLYKTALSMGGATLLIALCGARTRGRRRAVVCLSALLVGFLVVSGDRSAAFFFLLAAAFLWVQQGNVIPRRVFAVAVALALIIGPTVRLVRELSADERSADALREAVTSIHPLSIFEEMGASIVTLGGTLELVPRTRDYQLGMTWIGAAGYVLPNLGSSLARQSTATADLDPARWITAELEPGFFALGGGLGFSAIAEPYMNFGLPGVLAYFVLLGLVLARWDLVRVMPTPGVLVMRALILYPLLSTARNDMTNFFRPAAWSLFVVLGIFAVRALVQKRRAAGPGHPTSAPIPSHP